MYRGNLCGSEIGDRSSSHCNNDFFFHCIAAIVRILLSNGQHFMAILSLIFIDMNDAHTLKTILGWAATLLVTKEWITNTIHHSFLTIITSRKHCRENHRNVNKLKA